MESVFKGVWFTSIIPIIIFVLIIAIIAIDMLFGQLAAGGLRQLVGVRGGRGGTATGGAPRAGVLYRSFEGDLAALDTPVAINAYGGNAQSTDTPQGATVLDMIDIGLSGDIGTTQASVRLHCQVELLGQGFNNSPHQFGGPALTVSGFGTSTGAFAAQGHVRYENVGISVVQASDASIRGVLIGEDPGDATVCVTLGYVLG